MLCATGSFNRTILRIHLSPDTSSYHPISTSSFPAEDGYSLIPCFYQDSLCLAHAASSSSSPSMFDRVEYGVSFYDPFVCGGGVISSGGKESECERQSESSESKSGFFVGRLVGHERGVVDLAGFPIDNCPLKGQIVVSASVDRTVGVFNLSSKDHEEEGGTMTILLGHRRAVWSVDVGPFVAGHGAVFSSSMDKSAAVWDLEKEVCVSGFIQHPRAVSCVRFAGATFPVFLTCAGPRVRVFEAANGLFGLKMRHEFACTTVATDVLEPRVLYVGDSKGNVNIWDLRKSESPVQTTKIHSKLVLGIVNVSDHHFASCSHDGIARWDRNLQLLTDGVAVDTEEQTCQGLAFLSHGQTTVYGLWQEEKFAFLLEGIAHRVVLLFAGRREDSRRIWIGRFFLK